MIDLDSLDPKDSTWVGSCGIYMDLLEFGILTLQRSSSESLVAWSLSPLLFDQFYRDIKMPIGGGESVS